jgi:hypothetical protein
MKYDSEFRSGMQKYAQEQNQDVDFEKLENYRVICDQGDPEIAEICEPANELQLFEQGAIISIILGAALFLILFVKKLIAGQNRTILAYIMSPLTRIILIGLSFSIILQGALFLYGIYIAEAVFIGRVHFVAIGIAGLAALIG